MLLGTSGLRCLSEEWIFRRVVFHLSAGVQQSREVFVCGDIWMGNLLVPGEIVCFRIAKGCIQATGDLAKMGSIVPFDMRIALGQVGKTLVEKPAVYSGALVELLTVELPHFEANVGLRAQVFDDGAHSCQEREQIKSVNRFHVWQIGRHQAMHGRKAGFYLCTLPKVIDTIREVFDSLW
jgi:hypothetical protein